MEKLPRVDNSTKSPCWQQEQIAAQNSHIASAIASVQKGKEVEIVYKAPCKVDPPPAPQKKPATEAPKIS